MNLAAPVLETPSIFAVRSTSALSARNLATLISGDGVEAAKLKEF